MKIVCLVKQVPRADAIEFDEETKSLKREGVPLELKKEGADLVLCGRKTLDAETGQVPPEVAAQLGWPQLTYIAALELDGGHLRARRMGDEGDELYELELPAV